MYDMGVLCEDLVLMCCFVDVGCLLLCIEVYVDGNGGVLDDLCV